MNLLTFDIEEWHIEKYFHGGRADRYAQFDRVLNQLLESLEQTQHRATFFCVGMMANDFPDVIKRIAQHGHEIGCHSNVHTWLNKLSRQECKEDTQRAIDSLQQCTGSKVSSYRAPAYSIGKDNVWMFEILSECGITADSSIYPTHRDFGGFPGFPSDSPIRLRYEGVEIKEFPIAMTTIFNRQMAYSGGGYFRFFPYSYIKRKMKYADYGVCYFHIADLIAEHTPFMSTEEYETYFKESGTFAARVKRYLKENIGRNAAWKKMNKLLQTMEFTPIDEAVSKINWEACTEMNLKDN